MWFPQSPPQATYALMNPFCFAAWGPAPSVQEAPARYTSAAFIGVPGLPQLTGTQATGALQDPSAPQVRVVTSLSLGWKPALHL